MAGPRDTGAIAGHDDLDDIRVADAANASGESRGGTDPGEHAGPGGQAPPGMSRGTDCQASPGESGGSGVQAFPGDSADPYHRAFRGETAGSGDPAHLDESADLRESAGTAGLSLTSRIVLALAVAGVAVGVAVHCAMVFLHVAPQNTLSQEHAAAVNDYIYPEFEQNWKLFAPNPLQQNSDVQARAQVRLPDGTSQITGWVDLTAMDVAAIRHNPLPSHTQQNELRRAWSFYTDSHDDQNRAVGVRGDLSEAYVRRIVAHRFGPRLNGGVVERVQVRSATSNVAAPPWSSEKIDTRTNYRVLPWWAVSDEDFR